MIPISNRVILIQHNSKQFNSNIIQVYAPTSTSSEEEIENFYKDLNEALFLVKKADNTIVMGDFNVKVGKGQCQNIVCAFGLGNKNDRGDHIIQFCQDNNLIIANTLFKLHQR